MRTYLSSVALVVLLLGSACSSGASIEGAGTSPLEGRWQMVSFSWNGSDQAVELDGNTAVVPFVEFGEDVSGNAGCNNFGDNSTVGYDYTNGSLTFDDMVMDASECNSGLMETEMALSKALFADVPIEVTIDSDSMTWTLEGHTYEFERSAGG